MALGSLDAFPPPTPEDERAHAQLGRALAVATRFQDNCTALEGFSCARDAAQKTYPSSEERIATIMAIVTKDAYRRLGSRPNSIAARFPEKMDEQTTELLRDAVKARNRIAHEAGGVFCELPRDNFDVTEWRLLHQQEMRILVRQIALADRIVCTLLSVEDGRGLPSDSDWETYPGRAVAWVFGA